MSQPSSLPRFRKAKSKHDYASLNKKGFLSAKTVKIKSKTKASKRRDLPMTPGSGDWRVELLDKYDVNEQNVDTLVNVESTPQAPIHYEQQKSGNKDNRRVNKGVKKLSSALSLTQCKKIVSPSALPPLSPLAHDSTDIIHLVLQKNMSREDKKREVHERIAQLKRQLQEKEEYKELRVLMKEEEELKLKLAGVMATATTSSAAEKSASKATVGENQQCKNDTKLNQRCNLNQSALDAAANLQSLTGVKFDMLGFLHDDTGVKKLEVENIMSIAETKKTK